MAIAVTYYNASGRSRSDCAFLAVRYDDARGFKPWMGDECFVCSNDPSGLYTHIGTGGWFTSLWRSSGGAVWVCDSQGTVSTAPSLQDPMVSPAAWNHIVLDAALFGLWGIDEECVFTWGVREQRGVVFRWDGQAWIELPAPGFEVEAMHGTGPGDAWACGTGGSVAHWDGDRWSPVQTSNDEHLTSIFQAGPDEIYVTGDRGSVLEGSALGVVPIGSIPDAVVGDVRAVAKWGGELWIGAGRLGLWRRLGSSDQFECVKPNVDATHFDARWDMVITCKERISGTADGASFFSIGSGAVQNIRAACPLGQL
jgi:hypothetical protein